MSKQDMTFYLKGKVVWEFVLIDSAEWCEFTSTGGDPCSPAHQDPDSSFDPLLYHLPINIFTFTIPQFMSLG